MDVRDKAHQILDGIPEAGDVTSNGPNKALFTALTGYTQAMLEDAWKVEKTKLLTTCNAFVGKYGAAIGSKEYLGTFWPLVPLQKSNKTAAWIKSGFGQQPKYGDIFKLTEIPVAGGKYNRLHVGVSCDVESGVWNTVESGQGGPKLGFDILRRCKRTFDPSNVEGWIDIDILINGPHSPSLETPDWLLGWWKVIWRSQSYFYEFNRGKRAIWTQNPADVNQNRCAVGRDFATVHVASNGDITLIWNASGSREVFRKGETSGSLSGLWNGTELLSATKMP